jgi:hypothetical protein
MRVYVEGIGLCGPGFKSWREGREILAGRLPYVSSQVVLPACEMLPENERRRAVPTVRLAIGVCGEALVHAGCDAASTAVVFTSSAGDSATVHQILTVLATDEREISPTRFHNSVHNAPAGYWSIATHSRAPSTSVCAFNASFAAGLLEAAAQAVVENRTVMLVAYDLPNPEPLNGVRHIGSVFGMALVLTPDATGKSLARLDMKLSREQSDLQSLQDPMLEQMRIGNPAARSLALLAPIACGVADNIAIEHLLGKHLVISVSPKDNISAAG